MIGHVFAVTDKKERKIIKETLIRDASDRLFICEQLRFAYDLVSLLEDGDVKTDLTEQLIDIFGSAKKMNARLAYYKRHFGGETGNSGKNIIRLTGTRLRRKIRGERI